MRTLRITLASIIAVCALGACTTDVDVAERNSKVDDTSPTSTGGASARSESNGIGGAGSLNPTTPSGGSASGDSASGTSQGREIAAVDPKLLRSAIPVEISPNISDSDYAAFISAANVFGLELMQELSKTGALAPEKNGVFSPLSAMIALAMTYGGAEGEVAAAMKLALHDDLAAGQYHVAQNRLLRELANYNYEGEPSPLAPDEKVRVVLSPANSLWIDRDLPIQSSFLDLLSQRYDTGVYQVDFFNSPDPSRESINAWVAEKTQSKIRDLLKEGDVTRNTSLVLVNALYLYANWRSQFNAVDTTKWDFDTLEGNTVSTEMMNQVATLNHRAASGYQVLELPYANGELRMTLVLPDLGQFESVRSAVSGDWLASATQGPDSAKLVDVRLPKFEITTSQIQLTPALEEMGLFDGGWEVTGISKAPGLAISKVLQKAYIKTAEKGVEAAAATAVVAETTSIGPNPQVSVIFDRPFLYFIQAPNDLVLFAGQVTDPTVPTN